MENIETRNFLADAFLGRSVAPRMQMTHPPPPSNMYSHAASASYYPADHVDRSYYDDRQSRSRSHSRRKKRYYSSSDSSPEPVKRHRKKRDRSHSPMINDNNNNSIVNID